MRNPFPPFAFQRSREVYAPDRSIETTIRIVAFYRSLEIRYLRPLWPTTASHNGSSEAGAR